MDTKRRIEWLDVAKGIGIILVILGHVVALRYTSPLYTFHMPLFFLFSGLVFTASKYPTWGSLIKNKGRAILRPYLVIYLISLVISLIIPVWRNRLSVKQMLLEVYSTNSNCINNSSLWFLVSLFVVILLFYILYGFCKRHPSKALLPFFVILSLLLLWQKEILVFLSQYIDLPEDRLPLKLDTSMVALAFFAVGSVYKQKIVDLVEKMSITHICILGAFTAVFSVLNGWTNLNSLDFGRIKLAFYPIAFSGIFFIAGLSFYISKSQSEIFLSLKKLLLFYGRNSLLIFGFQSLFIRLYLLICNTSFHLDMVLYADNPWYHQIICFLLVTFVASPLVVYLFQFLGKRHINIL